LEQEIRRCEGGREADSAGNLPLHGAGAQR
jgi:hypothetical protein